MSTIEIDGKQYDTATFSDEVKTTIMHIQLIDAELMRLSTQMAIHRTARVSYEKALKEFLTKLSDDSQALGKVG
jgi:hypothetical protein